jgi:hypothetical protein
MNAIVLVALKRPYTFVVLAILILLFGGMAVFKTPTDVFPPIKIPVVAAVWTYNGLLPSDMSGRVVYYYERALTTTVGNIEHIESQSLYGFGVVKIYFQPGTDVAAAQAQVTATSQTVLKQLPAGITPPQVLVFDASSVPVLDLEIAADNMTGPRWCRSRVWRYRRLTVAHRRMSRSISTRPNCWRTGCPPPMWVAHSQLRTSCCRPVIKRSAPSITWWRQTPRRSPSTPSTTFRSSRPAMQ